MSATMQPVCPFMIFLLVTLAFSAMAIERTFPDLDLMRQADHHRLSDRNDQWQYLAPLTRLADLEYQPTDVDPQFAGQRHLSGELHAEYARRCRPGLEPEP